MLDLDALAALTEQAVGGAPWMAVNANEGDPIEYGPFWVVGTGIPDDDAWFAEIHVGRYEDAEFIAAIRNAAPELITAARERDELRAQLDEALNCMSRERIAYRKSLLAERDELRARISAAQSLRNKPTAYKEHVLAALDSREPGK